MKRFSEQFHKKSQSVSLTASEQQELRERVVSYMEYHPLPAELKTAKKAPATKSPLLQEAFKTVTIPFSLLLKSSAVAAAMVLVVVPLLAEQSMPGDTLYAVKVQFNEEVRGSLTFDSYQKVEWETQRVNRRIAEARLLESEGRLTDEVKARVAQAVRTHTQSAQKEIQNLREFDAEEATIASIEFGSNLEAQAASLQEKNLADHPELAAVAMRTGNINLIAEAVAESQSLNEQPNASTTPSYNKLIARVEQNTTRMYELSNQLETLSPETKDKIARRIADIERSVAQAIADSPTNELEARDILVDVLRRTQKLIVFMTDMEVSDSIDIDTLVPVMLTDEEKATKVAAFKTAIAEKQQQISAALEQADAEQNPDFLEKVAAGADKITSLSTQMTEATNFEMVRALAEEALAISDDLLLALENDSLPLITDMVELDDPVQSSSTATSTADSPENASSTTSQATTTASTSVDEL